MEYTTVSKMKKIETELYKLMEQCINTQFILKNTGREYQFDASDGNGQKTYIQMPNCKSVAFQLDTPACAFPFLHKSPPKGIAKMCDAIIMASYREKNYIVCVELKTNNKGQYNKQLTNGKLFCDYMLALLKEHEHFDNCFFPSYIALFIWYPRKHPERQTTTHDRQYPRCENPSFPDRCIEIQGQQEIRLEEILKDVMKSTA